MTEKESVRSQWRERLAKKNALIRWGHAAEKLRRMERYRKAATIFATPDESLYQARINCLSDGKNLVMPAPSLRDGFFLLPARSVPFTEISAAVTYKGLEKRGHLLKSSAISRLSVRLLLTGSLTVDLAGGRLGSGNGFFDLSCALLQELGGLQHDWFALTFIQEMQISQEKLPQEKWDIKISGAITPAGIHDLYPQEQKPRIFWEVLQENRIKRIDPLWQLYSERLKAENFMTEGD